MNNIAKALIAMLVMAALIWPSVALNPAYTIRITSPAVGTTYAVGQEVPIEFDTALQEGYTYQTFVNGIETDTWIPDAPGAYAVQVKASNPACGDCWDYDVMRNYFAA